METLTNYIPLSGHEDNGHSEIKRTSYEDMFDARKREIDKFNITELEECRSELKSWMNNVDQLLNEPDIKPGRKQYLIGLKNRVIKASLAYAKKRRATLNRIVCNGVSVNLAVRFVQEASKKLPLDLFQEIYGAVLTAEEKSKIPEGDMQAFISKCGR